MNKLVIFDFDGTLVHLEIDYDAMREELKNYFKNYGIESDFKPLTRRVLAAILNAEKTGGKEVRKEVFGIIEKHELKDIGKSAIFKNSRHVMETLKSMGFELAILSNNGEKCIREILRRMGTEKLVSVIFSRDNSKEGISVKPFGDGILEIMKRTSAEKENSYLVGDMVYDEFAARNAGIRFIAVNTGYFEHESDFENPDFMVNDIGEILDIIK